MPGLRRAPVTAIASALLLGLAACSSGTDTTGRPSPTTSPSVTGPTTPAPSGTSSAGSTGPSTTATADQTVEITVRGKQVTPAPHRVEMSSGQTLRLVVTSDHDDELHAHGFDVERALVAGQPTTVDLTGAPPGLYEIETHEPELRLLQVVVRP